MDPLSKRNAVVVEIDGYQVKVRDETDEIHWLSGSMIKAKDRVIGLKGTVEFRRGSSWALWFFERNQDNG